MPSYKSSLHNLQLRGGVYSLANIHSNKHNTYNNQPSKARQHQDWSNLEAAITALPLPERELLLFAMMLEVSLERHLAIYNGWESVSNLHHDTITKQGVRSNNPMERHLIGSDSAYCAIYWWDCTFMSLRVQLYKKAELLSATTQQISWLPS